MTAPVKRKDSAMTPGRFILTLVFAAGLVFMVAPIIIVVATSFTNGGIISFPPQGLGLRWYHAAMERSDFISALGTSVLLAITVSAFTLIIGILIALPIVRGRFRGRKLLENYVLLPLFVPNVVIGFAALPIISYLGLLGTMTAVFVVYAIVILPFVVRSLIGSFHSADMSLENAAQVFGASPMRAFFDTTLQLSIRGIFAASIFAVVSVMDEAVIINFIGGNDVVTFPMRFFSYLSETYDPIASVFATIMIVATTAVMLVLNKLMNFDQLARNLGMQKQK
ncbi:ABC transporter permease [uncultured Cohaesibacter sp.]|uniref:ABC transporter permease n=1 Tax=uncultured Cohaesibacter sp. TaxID=1002546 RepID=UPI0029C671BD|nr:ABC transporter permease [uncultured Cohaesibacter sp.]